MNASVSSRRIEKSSRDEELGIEICACRLARSLATSEADIEVIAFQAGLPPGRCLNPGFGMQKHCFDILEAR